MYKISIHFPYITDEPVVYYFSSIERASKKLMLSEYFLRNCMSGEHRNQFASYFKVERCYQLYNSNYSVLKKDYPRDGMS